MAARSVDDRTRSLQARSSAAILAGYVDPREDLAAERRGASFDPAAVTEWLYEGAANVARRRKLVGLLKADETFSGVRKPFMSREERYVRAAKISARLFQLVFENALSREDGGTLHGMIAEPLCLDLHWGMFLPTLLGQASDEQREQWLMPAMSLAIIGTYAQTELGHGTYLRGLETTATYDAEAQEFIVHSPTVTATKWWPGGLGKTATHAVVMARLMIDGKDYGPHAFFMQLRTLEEHKPLPGVTVGDIGGKMGFNGVDNGFLRFDHVRIPRTHMLMRHAMVSPEGQYTAPPMQQVNYGTMVFVRAAIVADAASFLGKAATICIRYNAVRRQTLAPGAKLETQVLDYQNNQDVLFTCLAQAFALSFTGRYMSALYKSYEQDSNAGELSGLPVLHATSSGLKALCTTITAAGIEACRRCCGGHGYSNLSGLPGLFGDYVGACTYEGENAVMSLQTARYLVKVVSKRQAFTDENLSYLNGDLNAKCTATGPACFQSVKVLQAAIAHVAARRVTSVAAAAALSSEKSDETLDLIEASKAHCYNLTMRVFAAGVEKLADPRARVVMNRVLALYGVSVLLAWTADLLLDGYCTPDQIGHLRAAYRVLLKALRPDAVALVDSWDFDDFELNSAIGKYDGNVYQALLEWASSCNNPMNATEQGPAYEPVFRSLIRSKL